MSSLFHVMFQFWPSDSQFSFSLHDGPCWWCCSRDSRSLQCEHAIILLHLYANKFSYNASLVRGRWCVGPPCARKSPRRMSPTIYFSVNPKPIRPNAYLYSYLIGSSLPVPFIWAGPMCWNRHSAQLINLTRYVIDVRIRIWAAKSSSLVKTFLKTIIICVEWTDRAS